MPWSMDKLWKYFDRYGSCKKKKNDKEYKPNNIGNHILPYDKLNNYL